MLFHSVNVFRKITYIIGTYIISPMKGLIQDMTEFIYYII